MGMAAVMADRMFVVALLFGLWLIFVVPWSSMLYAFSINGVLRLVV